MKWSLKKDVIEWWDTTYQIQIPNLVVVQLHLATFSRSANKSNDEGL